MNANPAQGTAEVGSDDSNATKEAASVSLDLTPDNVEVEHTDKAYLSKLFADDDSGATDADETVDLKEQDEAGSEDRTEDTEAEADAEDAETEDVEAADAETESEQESDEQETAAEDDEQDESEVKPDADEGVPEEESQSEKEPTDTPLSITYGDKQLTFESEEELEAFLDNGSNLVAWQRKLHQRGHELNKQQTALDNDRRGQEKADEEVRQWRTERDSALPPKPQKPDPKLNDPNTDDYDPAKYATQADAYLTAKEEYDGAVVDQRVKQALPKEDEPARPPTVEELDAAEKEWFTEQNLDAEAQAKVLEVADSHYKDRLKFLEARNGNFLRDDLLEILEKSKEEALGEKKVKVQDANVVKSLQVNARRGAKAPKRTAKAPAQADTEDSDPFSSEVSPAQFREQLRTGKLKLGRRKA